MIYSVSPPPVFFMTHSYKLYVPGSGSQLNSALIHSFFSMDFELPIFLNMFQFLIYRLVYRHADESYMYSQIFALSVKYHLPNALNLNIANYPNSLALSRANYQFVYPPNTLTANKYTQRPF